MRFQGYFKEHVVESRLENARVRKVTIFYYLEDKSIMITEPKQVNAGIPQGAFLKRHCVLKPDGTPFVPDDFCIGADTGIYGRQIRIYDCDDYTRRYYAVRLIPSFLHLLLSYSPPLSVTRIEIWITQIWPLLRASPSAVSLVCSPKKLIFRALLGHSATLALQLS